MWFETLMGFPEASPEQVRAHCTLDGPTLHSQINGKGWVYGTLETPSLAELRAQVQASGLSGGHLGVREVVADVQDLHTNTANAGALFQVASQFNLLEMASPHVTPEQGVGIYEHDHTQGPACAVAAGAGTIYRNYFAPPMGTSANQPTTKSIAWPISVPPWAIPQVVCGPCRTGMPWPRRTVWPRLRSACTPPASASVMAYASCSALGSSGRRK